MPYAPGVQNISGQLLARGIESAGDSIAQSIQQYQQNKHMAGQAIAQFEGAASSNPDMLQYLSSEQANPEIKSAFEKLKKGGSVGFKDAAALATFANSYQANKSAGQERKDQQALNDLFSTFQSTGRIQDGLAAYTKAGGSPKGLAAVDSLLSRISAPQTPHPVIDVQNYGKTDPTTGKPMQVSVDQLSGKVLGERPLQEPKYVLSPDEQAEAEQRKLRTTGAYKFNEDLVNAGAEARNMERNVNQAIGLMKETEGATGFGAGALLKAKQIGKAMGLDVGDIKNQEQLRVLFGNEIMNRVNQTKGAVSDREMRLFSDYSANFGNTPEGNKQILSFAKEAYKRAQEVSQMVRKMRKENKNEWDIQLAVEEYQDKNPLDNLLPKTEAAGPSVDDLVNKYLKK